MVKALEVYGEMKAKAISMDVGGFGLLLSLCAGQDRPSTHNSGQGCRSSAESGAGEDRQGSAQNNPKHAVTSAWQIYKDMMAAGVKPVPESHFSCLIRACCLGREADKGLEVLTEMKAAGAIPRLRTFSPLLALCAEMGRVEDCLSLWEGCQAQKLVLGDREYLPLLQACNKAKDKALFEKVMTEYMEDVLVPEDQAVWGALQEWFKQEGGWQMCESTVSEEGLCSGCGEVMRSVDLCSEMIERLKNQVEELVCTNEEKTQQWKVFKDWVEAEGHTFDVVIDGANVGYYRSKAAGGLDHRLIDSVVQYYEQQGKKPLVVLHSRHLREDKIPKTSAAVLKSWRSKGCLQSCAPNNNDDFYWLYAAVVIGARVLVVTNDEMRDHHFQMLSHRSFERWKERHQVHFGCGPGNQRRNGDLDLKEPPKYSHRMQRSLNGTSWHVPLQGQREWLCVSRPPARG
ncbi:unnamed protein product [Chrysoparadoxa australica]